MKKHYEVVVVGAGSVGMATGYFLAKNGIRTLLIDAFDPPHSFGSHHGETRLIRHATGEGAEYVALALRAQELWQDLERESGSQVFIPTGTLMVGEEDSPFIVESVKSAMKHDLSLEALSSGEIRRRWPGFMVPDEFVGYYEAASGALLNEKCIQAYRDLLVCGQGQGRVANLLTHSKVKSIKFLQSGALVETENDYYYGDRLVVCAGAWTGKILSSLGLPLQPMRKTFGWFEAKDPACEHTMMPSFYFSFGEQRYYGFPSIGGSGVKVGRSDSEREVDPDHMREDFGKYASDEGDLRRFLERFIPAAAGKLLKGKACMITKTPDKHFIVDRHPEFPHVIIACGFSGHGFKYSSVLGEVVGQLVADGSTVHEISSFSIARAALKGAEPKA